MEEYKVILDIAKGVPAVGVNWNVIIPQILTGLFTGGLAVLGAYMANKASRQIADAANEAAEKRFKEELAYKTSELKLMHSEKMHHALYEKKYKLYEEFIMLCSEYTIGKNKIGDLDIVPKSDENFFAESGVSYLAKIGLLGSNTLHNLGRDVLITFVDRFFSNKKEKSDDEKMDAYHEAMRLFIEAAREDLQKISIVL